MKNEDDLLCHVQQMLRLAHLSLSVIESGCPPSKWKVVSKEAMVACLTTQAHNANFYNGNMNTNNKNNTNNQHVRLVRSFNK